VTPELANFLSSLRAGNSSPAEYSEALHARISARISFEDQQRIAICDQRIEQLHDGQVRGDGAPYVIHPRRVALLASYWLAPSYLVEGILIALLHDVAEDCGILVSSLEADYGTRIAEAVDILSAAPIAQTETREERKARKLAKVERITNANKVVIEVHLADKLDNVISWRNLTPTMAAWQKIPRWLWQLETWDLPIAEANLPEVASELSQEIAFQRNRGLHEGSWRDA
jgi:(p)ppGpp synthase/HD superfamily hydrolase